MTNILNYSFFLYYSCICFVFSCQPTAKEYDLQSVYIYCIFVPG